MKKFTFLLFILTVGLSLYAENPSRMNNITVDIGAPGSIITVSYDRYIFRSDMHALSANAGIGTLYSILSFPVGIDYSFGQTHQLILGAHYNPVVSIDKSTTEHFTGFFSMKFGYRCHFQIFEKCPMFYQAYLSPSYNVLDLGLLWFATVGFGFNL